MKTKVGYLKTYLSEEFISLDDLIKIVNERGVGMVSLPFDIVEEKNIRKVYTLKREKAVPIFIELIEEYMQKKNLGIDDIDYMIYVDSIMDQTSLDSIYEIQRIMGLKNIKVFKIDQACGGLLIAMQIARSIIDSGNGRRILILADSFVNHDKDRFIGLSTVSDGLGLLEVTISGEGFELCDFESITDGSINLHNFFEGGNATKIIVTGANLIKSLLKRNGLTISDIKIIIPQNISVEEWKIYSDVLDCDINKVYLDNIDDGGHIGVVDTIRNLESIRRNRLVKEGEYLVAYGIGFGTSWNAILLKN